LDKAELERRTKTFAIRVIRFEGNLPRNRLAETLATQLLKSGTSDGANYREANGAESKSDFIHEIALVEKDALCTADYQYSTGSAFCGSNLPSINKP